MKYLKSIFTLLVIASVFVSCNAITGDPDLPIPLDETLSNTGAFLRVTSVQSPGFDVADLSTAAYSYTGEISDINNGQNTEKVSFYVSYIETGESSPPTIPENEAPIMEVLISDMDVSESSGLPRSTFTILLQDILDSFPSLSVSDLSLGDVFNIRWELTMDDGTTYTNTDISPSVSGGFYSSPFNARASVVQGIPQDRFVGEYEITQLNDGNTFNPLFEGSNTFTATLELDSDNLLNGRVIESLSYLSQFGGFAFDLNFVFFRRQDFQTFTATDNYATTNGVQDPSVGCGIGLRFGPVADETKSGFDVDDDSEFTFTLIDNRDSDCGGSPAEVTFRAVKQ